MTIRTLAAALQWKHCGIAVLGRAGAVDANAARDGDFHVVRIHVYTMSYSEEMFMPYFLRHYTSFAERVVVLDNHSSDRTADIVRSFPGTVCGTSCSGWNMSAPVSASGWRASRRITCDKLECAISSERGATGEVVRRNRRGSDTSCVSDWEGGSG